LLAIFNFRDVPSYGAVVCPKVIGNLLGALAALEQDSDAGFPLVLGEMATV